MAEVTVAATQMACSWSIDENIAKAEAMIRQAAEGGANVVLIQELFAAPYFCIEQHPDHQNLAQSVEESTVLSHMAMLAKKLGVVLPTSWFERSGQAFFNSLAIIDADGSVLGVYRKAHIPNSVGYQEKHYFSPGDTGFKVWNTRAGRLGVAICWDQWFPEAARCMALQGAEILFYPTAIGSEPADPAYDSSRHWENVMRGHAAANIMPVVASNRIGTEQAKHDKALEITFYGGSFIADYQGEIVAKAAPDEQMVLAHTFDLSAIQKVRDSWGVYRDRRPDLYGALATLDGRPR